MRNDRTACAESSGLIPAGNVFQRVALNARMIAEQAPATRTSTRRSAIARKQSALPI